MFIKSDFESSVLNIKFYKMDVTDKLEEYVSDEIKDYDIIEAVTTDISAMNVLTKNKYRITSTIVELLLYDSATQEKNEETTVRITQMGEDDIEHVCSYAPRLLTNNRYFKLFSNDDAIKLISNWIKNNYHSRAQMNLVAVNDLDKAIGYCSCIIKNGEMYIDLIAVDDNYQKGGIGRELINYLKAYCTKEKLRLYVKTQLDNYNAMNFYLLNGFTILNMYYILDKKAKVNAR